MKTFFIGDTHFGHKAIIDFENRPFKDVEEMDKALIENWNNAVGNDDRVFMTGDFSFYDKNKTTAICKSLKGHKILIKGNHDDQSEDYYRECGFESVYSYSIIIDEFWIISHKPVYLNKGMPYGNIYAHVHSNEIYKDVSFRSFCSSAERIGYTPIEWGIIKERMKAEE